MLTWTYLKTKFRFTRLVFLLSGLFSSLENTDKEEMCAMIQEN